MTWKHVAAWFRRVRAFIVEVLDARARTRLEVVRFRRGLGRLPRPREV